MPFMTTRNTAILSGRRLWTPVELGPALVAWWTPLAGVTEVGGVVSSWIDRVGGYDATQATGSARPVFDSASVNGTPGIWFDGSDDVLALIGVPSAFPTGAVEGNVAASVTQLLAGAGTPNRIACGYGGDGATARMLQRNSVASVNRTRAIDGSSTTADTVVDFSGPHIVLGRWQATLMSGRIDGAAFSGAATAIVLNTSTSRVRIGASSPTTAGAFWSGAIGHVIITNALTNDERDRLEGFLAWSMGGASLLPATHPYRNQRP